MSSPREKNTARGPPARRGKRRVRRSPGDSRYIVCREGLRRRNDDRGRRARPGAPIGSLYQFFPSKEVLADALLERFGERLDDALNGIEERATTFTVLELVDALLGLLVGFHEERAAAITLTESRQETSTRAAELRLSLRRHVTRILRARIPKLSPKRAEIMGSVVVQIMKAAAAQSAEKDLTIRDNVLSELKHLVHIYLNDVITTREDYDSVIR